MSIEAIRAAEREDLWVELDKKADRIPLVSTLTNFSDLLLKGALSLMDQQRLDEVLKSHFFQHIHDKSAIRCVTLLVPVLGNGIIYYYDLKTRQLSKPEVVNDEGEALTAEQIADVLQRAAEEAKKEEIGEEQKPVTLIILPPVETVEEIKPESAPAPTPQILSINGRPIIKPKLIKAGLGIKI